MRRYLSIICNSPLAVKSLSLPSISQMYNLNHPSVRTPHAAGAGGRANFSTNALKTHSSQLKLGVLIDGDNAQAKIVEEILGEVAKYGVASVKRVYGDWTAENSRAWKKVLLQHGIQPIQQFTYTTGKNNTDSAMIIDGMDLLHQGNLDGFCLVSSDSDFTRLASRMREDGLLVIGVGKSQTPQAFVASCDRFIYTEVLSSQDNSQLDNSVDEEDGDEAGHAPLPSLKELTDDVTDLATSPSSVGPRTHTEKLTKLELLRDPNLIVTLVRSVEASSNESGWAYVDAVKEMSSKIFPAFDSRNYGFKKFTELLIATDRFLVMEEEAMVKLKPLEVHDILNTVRMSITACKGDSKDQWVDLSILGGFINQRYPTFEQIMKSAGFKNMSTLVRALENVKVQQDTNRGGGLTFKVRLLKESSGDI
eukprot:CAMPEP_0114244138 /NCGR_PEP_ID=MMETSP0058-20121206/11174_1 /TAXON_ID=36894 /ORGANISM="Pyramimonas parkeae, CCMP726" /LENGTH=420 /DNA_ID=CAMNT_0001357047 /DNA_START=430 /DNA_END=1692 /DNA_ORIENTATION=-